MIVPVESSADASIPARSFATSKNPLLHVCDLYNTALCLRIFLVLDYGHVQFFLAFAEADIRCAITAAPKGFFSRFPAAIVWLSSCSPRSGRRGCGRVR